MRPDIEGPADESCHPFIVDITYPITAALQQLPLPNLEDAKESSNITKSGATPAIHLRIEKAVRWCPSLTQSQCQIAPIDDSLHDFAS